MQACCCKWPTTPCFLVCPSHPDNQLVELHTLPRPSAYPILPRHAAASPQVLLAMCCAALSLMFGSLGCAMPRYNAAISACEGAERWEAWCDVLGMQPHVVSAANSMYRSPHIYSTSELWQAALALFADLPQQAPCEGEVAICARTGFVPVTVGAHDARCHKHRRFAPASSPATLPPVLVLRGGSGRLTNLSLFRACADGSWCYAVRYPRLLLCCSLCCVIAMLCYCYAVCYAVCYAIAMLVAMLSLCYCYAVAMQLRCICNAVAMQLLCFKMVVRKKLWLD